MPLLAQPAESRCNREYTRIVRLYLRANSSLRSPARYISGASWRMRASPERVGTLATRTARSRPQYYERGYSQASPAICKTLASPIMQHWRCIQWSLQKSEHDCAFQSDLFPFWF